MLSGFTHYVYLLICFIHQALSHLRLSPGPFFPPQYSCRMSQVQDLTIDLYVVSLVLVSPVVSAN